MLEQGSCVLIVAHSQYRGVYSGIARLLHERYGATIHLYVATDQERAVYEKVSAGVFKSITVASALYTACRAPVADDEATLQLARANEELLGITINQLAMLDRHLGRGYALGGFRHPRSRLSARTRYTQMLAGFNAEIEFWADEISTNRPSLILNAGKLLSILARRNEIPTRYIVGSRLGNYHFWSCNEYELAPQIGALFNGAKPEDAPRFDQPYVAYQTYIERFKEDTSHWRTFKSMFTLILRNLYWRLRNYEKGRGYYLSQELLYAMRRRQATAAMTHASLPRLRDMKGKPFIFFPLATEPEKALQGLAPEYPYQLSAIASLSRDMPAGYEIIVKEHRTATGRRPAEFYQQISEFKNVRIMNMVEHGFDVVQEAVAVATISGTAGFEAAAIGKPVIAFGRHNLYNFLNHVMVVTDEAQLQGYLKRAVGDLIDLQLARRDGKRFLKAVVDVSFDLADFEPWRPDAVNAEALEDAFGNLMETLALQSDAVDTLAS